MSTQIQRLLLACALCALSPLAQAQAAPTTTTAPASDEATEPVNNSDLSTELFYLVLLGEIQAQTAKDGTELRDAFKLVLEAAIQTRDERLFERATRLAIQSHAGTAALQSVRAWKTALPQSLRAHTLSLDILISLNRIPESMDALQQALRVANPAERIALIDGLPDAYALVKEKKALAQQVERTLDPAQQSPQVAASSWVSIGRLRLLADDPGGALEAARMAAHLQPQSERPYILAIELINPARPLAEVMVKQFLSARPKDAELRFAYARALLLLDKPSRLKDALALVHEVIALRPEWPTPHLILGTIAHEQHDDKLASASIERYLQLSEASQQDQSPRAKMQAYLVLSSIALEQGDFERALYWLDRIDNAPDPLSLVLQRASIVAKQGHVDEALSLLTPVTDDTPAMVRRKVLAQTQLLREVNQYARAFDWVAKVRAQGNNEPELIYEQAMLAEKLMRYEVMEKLLRELMAIKPNDYSAYNALGFFLADHNQRLGEAKALIEKALKIAPNDPFVTDSLGWAEFRLGNFERARDLLEQAFQDKPDAEIGAHLGEVYWRMGQPDKARSLWQRALKIDPKNETLQKTIERLGGKS